ncbi:MAG TPA: hypothetical protein VLO11_02665 [Luteolibacter sp.]|nr:hypothetical protein [Luteolibacter sp.]
MKRKTDIYHRWVGWSEEDQKSSILNPQSNRTRSRAFQAPGLFE